MLYTGSRVSEDNRMNGLGGYCAAWNVELLYIEHLLLK